jgi:hypothetical protein
MSAEDYIKVFQAGDPLPKFDGFLSSKGKKFSARLKYNPDQIYNGKPSPGVEPVFE